jgi:diaminopimelate decarboxylase
MTKAQIFEAYEKFKDYGLTRFGLHTMVMSNDLNPDSLVETARLLLELIVEIEQKLNIEFEFINL